MAIVVELEELEDQGFNTPEEQKAALDRYVGLFQMIKGVRDVGYTEFLRANDIHQLDMMYMKH